MGPKSLMGQRGIDMAKSNFEGGIPYFTMGQAVIEIAFPKDIISCQYCPFCRSESDLKRYWCRLNNAMLYEPFSTGLPEGCPIEITGEIRGKKKG